MGNHPHKFNQRTQAFCIVINVNITLAMYRTCYTTG